MTKRMFVTAVLLLGSCVTPAAEDHDLARVSVDALVRDPAAWDGKRVEVVGIASNRFENLGLYSNFADYCSVSTSRKAIYVRWDDVRDGTVQATKVARSPFAACSPTRIALNGPRPMAWCL